MSLGGNVFVQHEINDTSTGFINYLGYYDEIQTLNDLGVITVAASGNSYRDTGGFLSINNDNYIRRNQF